MGCAGEPEECKRIGIIAESNEYTGEAFDESTVYYRDADRADAIASDYGIVTGHKHIYVDPNGDAAAVDAFGAGNSEFVWGTGASVVRSVDELKAIGNTYKSKISEIYKGATGKVAPSGRSGDGTWEDSTTSAREFFSRFPTDVSGNNMYSFLDVV